MKIFKVTLPIVLATLLSSFQKDPDNTEKTLVGTWKWHTVINTSTNDTLGLEMLTMGMAREVKTEFRDDHTYTEIKNKLEGDGASKKVGEWKLEENNTVLSMKTKEKWVPGKILKLTPDTLILQPREPFGHILIKQR